MARRGAIDKVDLVFNIFVNYDGAVTDTLSVTFAALADPTRRAMLARLAHGAATVNELAAPHDMSLPAISRHLKVLENAGLVSMTRDAQKRPRRLETVRLKQADDWMAQYRDFFEARLDRLEEHLNRRDA